MAMTSGSETPRRMNQKVGLLRRSHPLPIADERGKREPGHRHQDKKIGQPVAVDAVRPVRLGCGMERSAVGKDIRFHQFVEAVDEKLRDEDKQENGSDLEEEAQIHAMSVARPE